MFHGQNQAVYRKDISGFLIISEFAIDKTHCLNNYSAPTVPHYRRGTLSREKLFG